MNLGEAILWYLNWMLIQVVDGLLWGIFFWAPLTIVVVGGVWLYRRIGRRSE
ncbi:hypothetical protein [Fodinicurvata sediminis]|uniref:hypothetical protein n=1 Tax=Fodinicurvata sediminis TaxID=1121832 RepID=UPI0003B70EBD|nr:hypothetical protein [Fodinicurvata sediminis]